MTNANASHFWFFWDLYRRTGHPGRLDSPRGRFLVGTRLAYLEHEFEATGLAEVAWEAYRLARDQGSPLPGWILEFLDGVAAQQPVPGLADFIALAGRSDAAALPAIEQTGARFEFEVAARVVHGLTRYMESVAATNEGDGSKLVDEGASRIIEVIAEQIGQEPSRVRDCYHKHRLILIRPFEFKDKGREFLSSLDFAPGGGAKSGEARRKRAQGIDAAISEELRRWRSDTGSLPTPDQIWSKLRYRFRDWQWVQDLWEIKVDPETDSIMQRDAKGASHSIAKATFKRHFYRLRKTLIEKA